MMELPLSVASLLEHAARWHADVPVVSRRADGSLHRSSFGEVARRAARLAHALRALGVAPGDRVATLAWNGHRHVEASFAIPGIGAIHHTLNPRLPVEQLAAIARHAGDRVLLADADLLPLVAAIAPGLPELAHVVALEPPGPLAPDAPPRLLAGGAAGRTLAGGAALPTLDYESLLAAQPEAFAWPAVDERSPAALCYTSGTTGAPKGALATHRSTVLHALSCALAHRADRDALDAIAPVAPQFHVNAWGFPYVAAMLGSALALPGRRLDAASLYDLIEGERVTLAAAVPTVWWRVLAYVRDGGRRFGTLRALAMGGSNVPEALIAGFAELGVETLQGWGMTETSPVATTGRPRRDDAAAPGGLRYRALAGRPLFGVDARIVDDAGAELPRDGRATGELQVRGHWVASAYFRDPEATARAFTADAWFRTGDVATIDPAGYLRIVDRLADRIKSGGEWIDGPALEAAALAHPAIADAAAIAVPDPLWGERPLLIVVARPGCDAPDVAALRAFLGGAVPGHWLPAGVVAVDELPRTGTGKVAKRELRARYPVMPAAPAPDARPAVPSTPGPPPVPRPPAAGS